MATGLRRLFLFVQAVLTGLHNALFSFVLHFFESVNAKIRSRLPSWRLEEETAEHVRMTVEVFEVIVVPFSVVYLLGSLLLLQQNVVDSVVWGTTVFFYSSFLPDLTSVCRWRRANRRASDLPAYRKYAVLLFAPLFVLLLFSNVHLGWRTTETFHNLKSLSVYGGFLFLLGFVFFGGLPVSWGQLAEMLILPFYGALGYLAHLKVDRISLRL